MFIINGTYYSIIDHSKSNSDRILLGGNVGQCVDITVSLSSNKGYLSSLTYDEWCNCNQNLTKGMTINMAHTAINIVKNKYTYINRLYLNDESKQFCGNTMSGDLSHVKLFYFKLAFEGLTWYEKRFDANLSERHLLSDLMIRLDDELIKNHNPLVLYPNETNIKIMNLYKQSINIREFFEKLKLEALKISSTADPILCNWCSSWLEDFMIKILPGIDKYTDNWYINLDTIPTFNITYDVVDKSLLIPYAKSPNTHIPLKIKNGSTP
jgi:hypothetical protein